MREIKFKYGYSDGTNTFEKAFTLEQIEQGLQLDEISDSPLLINYTIIYKRQYTGLKDKEGKDIYEGDILKCFSDIAEVYYDSSNALFRYKYKSGDEVYMEILGVHSYEYFEVIGNIYENQELLKD